MKKKTKISLGCLTLLSGALLLSSCTASFCTITDKSRILFLFDCGVSNYHTVEQSILGSKPLKISFNGEDYSTNLTTTVKFDDINTKYLNKINLEATKAFIKIPSLNYFEIFDNVVLSKAFSEAYQMNDELFTSSIEINETLKRITFTSTETIIFTGDAEDYSLNKGLLDKYGYLKYTDTINTKQKLWTNWDEIDTEVRNIAKASETDGFSIDDCASKDYREFYKQKMNANINAYRSCLAIKTDDYGAYGLHNYPVQIEAKKWTNWKGLLEFLFVWPIGALVDVLVTAFAGIGSGWAQVLAIFVVTVIIRTIMLAATFKQSSATAKMSELQPEIAKIQAKYPNANTNQAEKQRLSEETARLYKKHKINPLSSLLVTIVQFPVFICVWGALQGSAALTSGSVFGLRLSSSISATLFNKAAWAGIGSGGFTALVLFILMALAQTAAMLLPQFIQKRKAQKISKLGRNPAQASQDKKTKWFTYIMLVMIIFMGFSLVSGMGIYWLVGALFSIAQTFVTQAINSRKSKKKKV